MATPTTQLVTAESLRWLKKQPDNSVDLVFCSPPYEDARRYGPVRFDMAGQAWVGWAFERFTECCRVSRGLVAWVVAGRTADYRWTATPALLIADLHRAGVNLRNPCIYERDGIPGSGGPDWLKSRYEWIVCATPPGRLPWSDPTAMGWDPKYPPGGPPSHRTATTSGYSKGDARVKKAVYRPPAKANPGNIIDCGPCGGGRIGDRIAHENEAPFPEKLAEFFVRSFCPPGGTVLDIFGGSGTTAKAALMHGRNAISVDIRKCQTALTKKRLQAAGEHNE